MNGTSLSLYTNPFEAAWKPPIQTEPTKKSFIDSAVAWIENFSNIVNKVSTAVQPIVNLAKGEQVKFGTLGLQIQQPQQQVQQQPQQQSFFGNEKTMMYILIGGGIFLFMLILILIAKK